MDAEDCNVDRVEVRPANCAEVNNPPGMVDALIKQGVTPGAVLMDKGFASEAHREHFIAKEIGDRIQFKGCRGKPEYPLQTRMKEAIATLCFKDEQGFGILRRHFSLGRVRYFGQAQDAGADS